MQCMTSVFAINGRSKQISALFIITLLLRKIQNTVRIFHVQKFDKTEKQEISRSS